MGNEPLAREARSGNATTFAGSTYTANGGNGGGSGAQAGGTGGTCSGGDGFHVPALCSLWHLMWSATSLRPAQLLNPAFIAAHGMTVAGAEAALIAGMLGGQSYLNIHTMANPTGEIRGLLPAAVPGPIAGAGLPGLMAACGALLAFARRRRKLVA